MYAVIEVGAKQYTVKEGDVITVERQLPLAGQEFNLDKVLLVSDDKNVEVGKPYLKAAMVSAIILKHIKGQKVVSYKYRRRKSSHWKKGHRQQLTQLKIKGIKL